MCSTPQKHPAATVAVSAPAGTPIGAAGAELIEKDRTNRDRNDIEMYAASTKSAKVRSFSLIDLEVVWGIGFVEDVDQQVFYVNIRSSVFEIRRHHGCPALTPLIKKQPR